MELNENADIDTSQVEDRRGSGGGGGGLGGLPIGGGGLVGIIITIVVAVVGGYFGINQIGGGSDTGDNTNINQECKQEGALDKLECRNVLYINSIQAYWRTAAPENFNIDYQPAKTVIFSQRVNTACGAADSGVGPFYCPGDNNVYIDLTFYQVLSKQLGAPGEFAQPYVLAHEYGHHIQDITGTEAKMRRAQQGASEAEQNALSVKLELQADCYAGAWAKSATATTDKDGDKIFKSLTQQDIQEGIQTAGQIGDDELQKRSGNPVNPEEFTHGTSAQRQQAFSTGYDSGSPKSCATSF
ncbi:membrane protein [Paractinoplanes abujensis]|uniref:Putative metalloprotease n=1 Tax=Paractinoplanes abujensis TaxID=882441 RepID=A0A7W7CT41_9ACTN|nr:neutral zinc metallopeptidase [Actinoplanes abujensis]MBB4694169.1 putative metalloprotease [Actinoplanes abujensis]GID20616.1 membrane protein [Actinoplanes abujensis]